MCYRIFSKHTAERGSTLTIKLQPTTIVGVGSYVPKTVLTNDDIRDMRPADIPEGEWTDDSWILPRTGIRERRAAPPDWGSSDLMLPAANRALADANLAIGDIDLIITSTSFPDKGCDCPRTSEIFKSLIGAPQTTLSVTENAECAGFDWALIRAQEMMTLYGYERVMVVSGDKTSSAANPRDRKTWPLFGDAGGCVILAPCDEGDGFLASIRGTDTEYIDAMEIPAGGSKQPATMETVQQGLHYMVMPGGGDMLKVIGGNVLPDLCRQLVAKVGVPIEQVRHIVLHQANIRITNAAERRLGARIFKETQLWFGNTSGSSVPLALDTLYLHGELEPGDYIIIAGFGAGFIWGGLLLRWTKPRYRFAG